jgi:hypothetical protein
MVIWELFFNGNLQSRCITRDGIGYASGSEYHYEILRRCRGVLTGTEPPGTVGNPCHFEN